MARVLGGAALLWLLVALQSAGEFTQHTVVDARSVQYHVPRELNSPTSVCVRLVGMPNRIPLYLDRAFWAALNRDA